MKTYFIGIDISKDTLDICLINDSDKQEIFFTVENTVKGIESILDKTFCEDGELRYCFENTGNYGLLLAGVLEQNEKTYYQVPALAIKLSQGIQRGKNDKTDAFRIARYAKVHSDELVASRLPKKGLLKVKHLLTYRNHLVKIRTQFKNQKKSFQHAGEVADVSYQTKHITAYIEQLNKDIASTEKEIQDEIENSEDISKNFEKITKIKGVGFLTAAYMVVLTDNFTSFKNPRKFNCYAGLAPFEHSSGSSIKGKTQTSKLRNKTIKTILFSGANAAVIHDEELKAYYKRKKQQGKPHKSIINAVCCKLVYRIFAVIKRDEPFVNLIRYNLHMS